MCLEPDGEIARNLVHDHHGHGQGVHALQSALRELAQRVFYRLLAADAVAEDDREPLGVDLPGGKTRLRHGLDAGDHRVLREPVHATGVLRLHHLLGGEARKLARDFRGEVRHVEPGDPTDAALARLDSLPGILDIVAQGIHGPQAGHDDPAPHRVSFRRHIESPPSTGITCPVT
jgi:hypothetical protein